MLDELVQPAGSGEDRPQRWDRRGRDDGWEASDYGWIGEDDDGVWIVPHPDLAMVERPHLLSIVDLWSHGVLLEMGLGDLEALSHWEAQARRVLVAAHRRQERRELEEMRGKHGDHRTPNRPHSPRRR